MRSTRTESQQVSLLRLGSTSAGSTTRQPQCPLWVRDRQSSILGAASIVVPPRDGTSAIPTRSNELLAGIHERNPIEKVCMDPSDGRDIAMWLEDELGCLVVENVAADPAEGQELQRFMEGLRGGTLKHSGDPG